MTLWGGVHSAYHLTKETLYAGGLTWHSLRVAEVRNTGAIQTHYTARTRYFPHPHWFAQVVAQGDMTRCHRLWTRHPTHSTGDSDPLHSLRARHSPHSSIGLHKLGHRDDSACYTRLELWFRQRLQKWPLEGRRTLIKEVRESFQSKGYGSGRDFKNDL